MVAGVLNSRKRNEAVLNNVKRLILKVDSLVGIRNCKARAGNFSRFIAKF
jgi:hypothetical protein